mmetsp:Transcript_52261/g.62965  ORF Transcript_52261/g.62965 Transcript_52261/m.62965 type:complete len:599 (+) Transcript_52261:208-2004(+)|eukprot:CAMPEP_0172492442 /NCGR_PEP_ID=MMETSP1066-20121228/23601_1 /TAXON_ID=671091 /ORGANISM="Coscinodiscus wailesii, Strain CCMP2513" /LENGTH=598 /DNA_ID=CAMNT_0013262083 /DNA_START=151 /DNA_END=1947 /DNA_ORIENTATION=-
MTLTPREILLTLTQGDQGLLWASKQKGWSVETQLPVCNWTGIICDPNEDDLIEVINLDATGLIGTIPSELGLLNTLTSISMPQNSLNGTVPPLVANLPHLEMINLAENELSGNCPNFASPVLSSIELQHNLLTGTLPYEIGLRHPRLNYFDVSNNQIGGTIPNSISKLIQLQTLGLADNKFSGTIPSSIGNLRGMIFLFLNGNKLLGTIPPELAATDSPMAELWLQHNLLSGTIPAALSELAELETLYLEGNKFTGMVPPPLCDMKLNEEFFDGVPEGVEKDYCDSIACNVGYFSLEGSFPCKKCPVKFSNPYLGRLGKCVDLNQDDILNALYENWKISAWKETIEFKSNAMTPDDWCGLIGVRCDDGNNVIALNLKGMSINGTIPEELGFLEFLQSLDISDNFLTGYIPSDLRWAPIHELDLSGNQLVGIVPSMLCLKGGINGNGENGEYDCLHVACPIGTYSAAGWGKVLGADNENKCLKCSTATYLGSKTCPTVESPVELHMKKDLSGGSLFGVFLGIMFGLIFAALIFMRYFGTNRLLLPTREEHYDAEITVNDDMYTGDVGYANGAGDERGFKEVKLTFEDDDSQGTQDAILT